MTHLIASIPVESVAAFRENADHAWRDGATAIELRIDAYDGDPQELNDFLAAHRERTWIITCRSAEEGGHFQGDTMERVSFLLAVVRGNDVYVDFEWADWQRSANIRQKIGLGAADSKGGPPRLILSSHDFERCPADLAQTVSAIRADRPTAVVKSAFKARDINESFAALDLLRAGGANVMSIAMGEAGLWTRVLARKLGAFGSFCALDDDQGTAPGQATLREMTSLYRWSDIGDKTRIFGVIGDPVAHSMGPALFNHWFTAHDIDAVYLPLLVSGGDDALGAFLDACRKRPWLDAGGFSVTIPHKCAALEWIGNGADARSRRIGAINTLAFKETGARGWNTDSVAAIDSMLHALGATPSELKGVHVDVLGTGGAARAILAGLADLGCRTTIYGRSVDKTRQLARDFGAGASEWNTRGNRTGSLVINCTSLGMWPIEDETPLHAAQLSGCDLVFDIIYNPVKTRLLHEAEQVGSRVLGGLDMFVRQAALQLERWTGVSPDRDAASALVSSMIEAKRAQHG